MTPHSLLALATVAVCAVAPSIALANRPLNTETADVVPEGQYQLETYAARTRATDTPTVNGWTTQLTRGMGWRTQLSLAYGRERADGESASSVLLGGKSWLIELGDDQPGVAVAYGLSRSRTSGESWRQDTSYLTLVGTQPFGKQLLVHANLGWNRSAIARESSTTWAFGLEYSTGHDVNLIAETFGDDRGKPTVSVGALWQIAERFSVNGSYGVTRENPRLKQWTLGFQLDF